MAWPDVKNRRNLFAVTTPYLGSWLATGDWNVPMQGLSDFPETDWPPVLIPFFSFRLMVGLGMIMLGMSALGLLLTTLKRLEDARWYLWLAILASPAGFAAVILGWFTSEVGRQPWAVYGLIRTAAAVTPTLSGGSVLITLTAYAIVYTLLLGFGCVYGYGILSRGPSDTAAAVVKE
jgi:cytochrome d ubiquinol oxidase subunit I